MTRSPGGSIAPAVDVEAQILALRGRQVILDAGLAATHGVTTRALNQAVKRNLDRFPSDFVFQLSTEELAALRSQIVTSNVGHGGRRSLPMAFSEHGALMAASVLNSPRAIEMSVFLVRAFIRLRDAARTNAEIAKHLALLERRVTAHDAALKEMFSTIRALIEPPRAPKKQIGFRVAP